MKHYTLLASGYGSEKQATIGYYKLTQNGEVLQANTYTHHENPSFLKQVGNYLFVIQERSENASVSSYERGEQELKHVDTLMLQGTDLCHITYSERWSILLGACYGTGDVFALGVTPDGKLGQLSLVKQEAGEESISRAHCMVTCPSEDYAYGVNIASDRVVCYTLDDRGIIPNSPFPYLQLPKGEGPRHMQWHPHLNVAYIITEYSNRIFVVQGGKSNGQIEVIQTTQLLANQDIESYGATICINSEGTKLYAANRGMDTITQMDIEADGKLVYRKETSAYGCWPRHIALTSDQQRLLIANQKSGKMSMVAVDAQNGELGELLGEIDFPQVSFVAEWTENTKTLG